MTERVISRLSPRSRHGQAGTLNHSQSLRDSIETRSSQRTRAALLALDDCPTERTALAVLWEENHAIFESQMKRHLNVSTSPALLKRVISGVASLSKFYCDEIDDPKAWVARCANLEARRVALQLSNYLN